MSVFGAVASLPQTVINLINPHTKTSSATNTLRGGVKAADSTSTTATSTAAQATIDIGSTFLSLLTKELQNQDPTAPMDSTAMVGQMISLNQLDQLIAINQTLSTATTATKNAKTIATADSASTLAAQQALLAGSRAAATTPSGTTSATPLSVDPTLNTAAQAAASTGTLNLTNFNSMFGGNK